MSTAALQLRSKIRTVTDHAVTVLAILATILVIAPLAVIFAELVYKGASSLDLNFFTKIPAPEGETGGGMANAIVGSGVLLGLASLIGIPIGIVGGIILGLGRALGETMAVLMVIGNTPEIHKSLLANGATMASVIANEFAEATSDLHRSALVEIGLALFLVTIIVNAIAQVLVWAVTRGTPSQAH